MILFKSIIIATSYAMNGYKTMFNDTAYHTGSFCNTSQLLGDLIQTILLHYLLQKI